MYLRKLIFHRLFKYKMICLTMRTISRCEVQILFLYESKLDHSATKACRNMNKAFGSETVSERSAPVIKKFRSGHISIQNEPRPFERNCPRRSHVARVISKMSQVQVRNYAHWLFLRLRTIFSNISQVLGPIKICNHLK